ncbi:MAG: hypothetical protein H5T86_14675, partial [Armatimonadetes bacterium]|nr:hypothetical protein [Armatimonadota bacterium]
MRLCVRTNPTRSVVIAVAAVAAAIPCVAGQLSAEEILRRSMDIQKGVRDYTCRVTLHFDFPNVRMSKRTLTVYVKKPDKVRVESQGELVILPKDVLLMGNIEKRLEKRARVVLIASGQAAGRPVFALKLIPADPERAERLQIWIWGDTWTLKRTELWQGKNKVMAADWLHTKVSGFWMPSKVVCHVTGGQLA